jgi:hypothetical protein
MPGIRLRWIFTAALGIFAVAATAPVRAQMPSQLPATGMPNGPIAGPTPARMANQAVLEQPVMLEQASPPVAMQGSVVQPSRPVTAPSISSPAGCSCGELHGVSRWWWHKTQCKRRLQECALGYPEEFNEWPLGSSLYAHGRTQVANGNAARMVFYHYDFVDGSSQLNVRGRDKLARVAQSLPVTFFPVVIERTASTRGLDEQRRVGVLAELSGSRFPIPPERVVIGPPIAAGLAGYEAIYVYGNQLGALRGTGAGGVGGYSGTAGLDGGGLSGSAVSSGFGR